MKKTVLLITFVLSFAVPLAFAAGAGEETAANSNGASEAKAAFGRGLTAYRAENYDQAIAEYTEAIRLDPSYSDAYINRGNAYSRKGDYDRAIADYDQAISLNPNDGIAYYNRGLAYFRKDDYDKAIVDYTEAIRLDPSMASAYNNRGNAYRQKGDNNRAIADYEAALRIDPNHTAAKNSLERIRSSTTAQIPAQSSQIQQQPPVTNNSLNGTTWRGNDGSVLNFINNSNFTVTVGRRTVGKGSYVISGNTVTMVLDDDGPVLTGPLVGNTLILTDEEEGDRMRFTKQ